MGQYKWIAFNAEILEGYELFLRRNVGHCNEKDRKSGDERARKKW